MTLVDLIPYLTLPTGMERLYLVERINRQIDAVLIYGVEPLSTDSELRFFSMEETEDDQRYQKEGIVYDQLFPLDYAKELIESDLQLADKGYSDFAIATRLLEYWTNDA